MPRVIRIAALAALTLILPLTAPAQGSGTASAGSGNPEAGASGDKVLATVDGKPVHLDEVRTEVNRVMPMKAFHGTASPDKVQEIARQAMQTEIDRLLKRRDAERRGLKVEPSVLEGAIERARARYKEPGKFEEMLKGSGATIDSLREGLRRRLLLEQVEAVVRAEVPKVTVADAKAYYEANLDRFREPKRVELRQIFFKVPPNGRTEELWKKTEERALEARKRALAGESFESLVAELSEARESEKARGGLLGAFHRGQLQENVDEAVWSVGEGGITQPLRSFYGVHLIKVSRILPARLVPFSELADGLVKHLQKEREDKHLAEWTASLRAAAKIEYLDPYFAPAS